MVNPLCYSNVPKLSVRQVRANSVDRDQTAPGGTVWSERTQLASKHCIGNLLVYLNENWIKVSKILSFLSSDPKMCFWQLGQNPCNFTAFIVW